MAYLCYDNQAQHDRHTLSPSRSGSTISTILLLTSVFYCPFDVGNVHGGISFKRQSNCFQFTSPCGIQLKICWSGDLYGGVSDGSQIPWVGIADWGYDVKAPESECV